MFGQQSPVVQKGRAAFRVVDDEHELIRPLIVDVLQVVVYGLAGQVQAALALKVDLGSHVRVVVVQQDNVQIIALEIRRDVHSQDLIGCQRQCGDRRETVTVRDGSRR